MSNRPLMTSLALIVVFALGGQEPLSCAEPRDDGWVSLFNGKDLQGWYTFLDRCGKNSDPEKVFAVEDGVIHIYAQSQDGSSVPLGFFSTETEYSHYHLQFQYKWGKKRFGDRAAMKRDAGVMYHCVGRDGVLGKTWPRCVECQVQEGDTGDALCLAGARYSTWIDPNAHDLTKPVEARYLPATRGGTRFTASVWVARSEQRDQLEGWNTVDVIVMGNDYAVHMVNGHVNHRLSNLEQRSEDGSKWTPLVGGRIVLQAELAEVYYRAIRIRPIPTGPFRPEGSALVADTNGAFQLHARDATLQGPSLRFQPDENATLGHWHDLKDVASWTIKVDRPGKYAFELEWSIDDAAAVNSFRATAGKSSFDAKVPGTGGWWSYKKKVFGEVQLEPGIQKVSVQPTGELKGALMDIQAIRLVP